MLMKEEKTVWMRSKRRREQRRRKRMEQRGKTSHVIRHF